jgi:uncharacterized protein YkwD
MALLLILPALASAADWLTDPQQAFALSRKSKKPLLVLLTSSRSVNADYMLRRVFPAESVAALISSRYVALKSDFDHETWFSPWMGELKLFRHELPVVLIFSNDRVIFHQEGLIPPGRMESILARFAAVRITSPLPVRAVTFDEAYADFRSERWDDALAKLNSLDDASLTPEQALKKHFSLGVLSYLKKDYENAVLSYLRANEIRPMPNTLYNLACAFNLKGDRSSALYYLERAVRSGFSDVQAVRTDADLSSLRKTKEYAAILGLMNADARPTVPSIPAPPAVEPSGTTSASKATAQEKACFDQVNLIRSRNGLPPLRWADDLLTVARAHSEDMVRRDFFDHRNPDGESPFQRMERNGISYGAAAENIAYNMGYADPVPVAVQGWENSPGHFRNIINPELEESAIGIARSSDGRVYFTQAFIKRK